MFTPTSSPPAAFKEVSSHGDEGGGGEGGGGGGGGGGGDGGGGEGGGGEAFCGGGEGEGGDGEGGGGEALGGGGEGGGGEVAVAAVQRGPEPVPQQVLKLRLHAFLLHMLETENGRVVHAPHVRPALVKLHAVELAQPPLHSI